MLTWKIVGVSKVSVLYYLNIMLTWKIVGASKASVLYIYIYIDESDNGYTISKLLE